MNFPLVELYRPQAESSSITPLSPARLSFGFQSSETIQFPAPVRSAGSQQLVSCWVKGNTARVKMMESDVLKFICANQGSVDTDYLLFNLGFVDTSNMEKIICNREKFASCCPFGRPKVVARTSLRLCRDKDCQGSCRGLHLCKNFLLSGSCHFLQLRCVCVDGSHAAVRAGHAEAFCVFSGFN